MTPGQVELLIKARIFQHVLLQERGVGIYIEEKGENLFELRSPVSIDEDTVMLVPVEQMHESMIGITRDYMADKDYIEEQIRELTQLVS